MSRKRENWICTYLNNLTSPTYHTPALQVILTKLRWKVSSVDNNDWKKITMLKEKTQWFRRASLLNALLFVPRVALCRRSLRRGVRRACVCACAWSLYLSLSIFSLSLVSRSFYRFSVQLARLCLFLCPSVPVSVSPLHPAPFSFFLPFNGAHITLRK